MKDPMFVPHKITLDGAPIPAYEGKKPRFVAILKKPGVQTIPVAVAFMAAGLSCLQYPLASIISGGIAPFYLSPIHLKFLDVMHDRALRFNALSGYRVSKKTLTSLCINKAPETTSPEDSLWRQIGKRMCNKYVTSFAIAGAGCAASPALVSWAGITANGPKDAMGLTVLGLFLPPAVHMIKAMHRWHKVYKGDWVIEEKPKPETKRVPELTIAKAVPALIS